MSDRNTLKSYFNTGDRPTEAQFADLIDSLLHKQDDLVSQAEAEAGVATTPRTWTAERIKQAIAALAGGGATYDGHEFFWCILRNTGTGWQLLDDGDHTPYNVVSCTNDSNKITINYGKTYAEVGSIVIVPDDELNGTYTAGPKGLLTGAEFFLKQAMPSISGRLLFSGGVWSAAALQSAGSMVLSGTFPNFTITHTGDDCASNPPMFVQANTRAMGPITDQSIAATNTRIYLDPGYTAVDSHRLFFTRERNRLQQFIPLNPTSLSGTFINWWVLGVNKLAI